MSKGAVLGRQQGKTCALIVHIQQQDLICVREKLMNIEEHCWRYFRVDSQFHPVSLELPNRCLSKRECAGLLLTTETAELDQIDFSDEGLLSFFAGKHPDWLQAISDRQISHWQRHKPDKFFRLAPSEAAVRDIPSCVKESPFAALSRFQDQLDRTQLALCLIRDPRAAVMFALDKIHPLKREGHLTDYPKEALLFASEKLTDEELALCAKFDMFTAFQYRNRMVPERRAILLASSYMIACSFGMDSALDELQEEIRVSLIEFPEQWRASDPGGFPSILAGLMEHVDMDVDYETISALLEKACPADQKALANLIAQRI